jgi:hypothetical protein
MESSPKFPVDIFHCELLEGCGGWQAPVNILVGILPSGKMVMENGDLMENGW